MVQSGDIIESAPTGERVVFRRTAVDTGAAIVEFDRFVAPSGQDALFEGEPLYPDINRDNARYQLRLGGRKLLMAVVGAISRHDAKRTGGCV